MDRAARERRERIQRGMGQNKRNPTWDAGILVVGKGTRCSVSAFIVGLETNRTEELNFNKRSKIISHFVFSPTPTT